MKKIRPVYVDGPLEGQDFPADPCSPYVQAVDWGTAVSSAAGTMSADYVTYELRETGFHAGGKGVMFWVGSCAPGEPDAVTVFRALCKPELFERAKVLDMPARVTP